MRDKKKYKNDNTNIESKNLFKYIIGDKKE